MIQTDKKKIAIIGYGVIGKAVGALYEDPITCDIIPELCCGNVHDADIVFITVPSPTRDDGSQDLLPLVDALAQTRAGQKVVIKSTVLPGTTDMHQRLWPEIDLFFAPEFANDATAVRDIAYPDKTILGYSSKLTIDNPSVAEVLAILPEPKFGGRLVIPAKEAEMIKYAVNALYTTKVIFANEIYDICQKLGIDYDIVRHGMELDKRIYPYHLDVFHKGYRGVGSRDPEHKWWSKCLNKDTYALATMSKSELLKLVLEINQRLLELSDG